MKKIEYLPLLDLPEFVLTKGGATFCPSLNPWSYQDGVHRVHADFERIPKKFSSLKLSLQQCLIVVAQGYSPRTVQNQFESFIHFASTASGKNLCTEIGVQEIQRYFTKLGRVDAWRIGQFNVLLQRWFALGHPGVSEDGARYLRERRKPGNPKGGPVRTQDPQRGPFSEAEYTLLYKSLDAAYGAKKLVAWAFVFARLLFALGQRPSQYAAMKAEDLVQRDDGSFFILVPRGKRRLEHCRKELVPYDLSPQTGALVRSYISANGLDDGAPLFPVWLVLDAQAKSDGQGDFEGHCTGTRLSSEFSRAAASFAPPTERLDFQASPISPVRFRYTLGTRLVEEGCSKVVVAERLGHTDLQNVGVYFEASPKIVDNIDKAIGGYLAPIARAFRGRLIKDETDSTLAGAPGTRIVDFKVSDSGLGNCGVKGGCGFDKPKACYTCFKFEPWLDAPHEALLGRLLREKAGTSDERVSQVDDVTIEAVREVIAECKDALVSNAVGH